MFHSNASSYRAVFLLLFASVAGYVLAQGPGRARKHTATKSQAIHLLDATEKPPARSQANFSVQGGNRKVQSNAIPEHLVGQFPNRGNPNSIAAQNLDVEIPANPKPAGRISSFHESGGPFGIALNGVLFDPGTAEFWQGDRGSGWNYEALGGAVALGLDSNYAHVQPTGSYHYHGHPTLLMKRLGFREGEHSPQIGWAADGFPIYALYGAEDPKDSGSAAVELKSSYRLKPGNRPGGNEPDGKYDGSFVQDYEYVAGLGDLDECNGRFCKTPEFPDGTYAYFLSKDWPVVPRNFKGTPSSLRDRRGGGPGGPGGHPPGGRPPGGKGKGKGPPPRGPKGGKGPPPPPR